jgi:hypothetical protein
MGIGNVYLAQAADKLVALFADIIVLYLRWNFRTRHGLKIIIYVHYSLKTLLTNICVVLFLAGEFSIKAAYSIFVKGPRADPFQTLGSVCIPVKLFNSFAPDDNMC